MSLLKFFFFFFFFFFEKYNKKIESPWHKDPLVRRKRYLKYKNAFSRGLKKYLKNKGVGYNDPDGRLEFQRLYKGFNHGMVKKLLKKQKNKCAICKNNLDISKRRKVLADHNHVTGEGRGILCNRCNTGLGFFKDKISILKSAINYLQNPPLREIKRPLIK